jgi:putative salt-induced outer membrane protein
MRRRTAYFRVLFVALLATGLSRVAAAQTPAPTPPPPQQEGSAEFAYVGTTGNSSTQTVAIGGEYVYRPSPWETRIKVNYIRNEADDQVSAQSLVLTARAQRPIQPRLSGYGQYGYQRDRFAGILDRNALEAGLAYSLVEQAPHKLVVDGSLGYANEQRLIGNNLSTATLGAGGVYTLKISPTSDLSEDGHFVFSLSDGSDWRYANSVALTAKITIIFSLKLSNIIRYVNLPVVGFKTTDVVTSVALVAKF